MRARAGVVLAAALACAQAAGAAPPKPSKPAPAPKAGAPKGAAPKAGAPKGSRPKPPPPAPPPPPLAMLPSIARVRIVVTSTQLVVIEEVNLPRGEWNGEALDFWVAYGAPGTPRAADAHLVAVGDGALEPEDADGGEALSLDHGPRRPTSAHALLGRDTMAGFVVHVPASSLARALGPGGMAALRVRTTRPLPDDDPDGAKGVVVRLGASRGTPLTLGRIVLAVAPGVPAVTRAEAHLCGPEAEPLPLALSITPRAAGVAPSSAGPGGPIAPVLAVRRASDDLCVRFWTARP